MARALCLIVLLMAVPTFAAGPIVKRGDEDNLTWDFARFRRTQVKAVDYNLNFVFNKGSEEYTGKAILRIELARLDAPLSIDFTAKTIQSIKVNGTPLTAYPSRKGSFDIPPQSLAKSMEVEVEYVNAFNKDGHGMQRSVDPEDKAEYVYSDFEPYYAHHLFPCFDQPDIKSTYITSVDAPNDWKAIANSLTDETKTAKSRTITRFQKTKPLSSYLYFVGAGPFVVWTDKHGTTPIELYARKTLSRYVDADRIFSATKKGLKFFEEYFAYPYPFQKYGMIFVPEFSWGGMENPGAVTLNERSIFRGTPTQTQLNNRDDLILHEMAHMWFGDLVTMQWWNDLWLNESFASYLAAVAQDTGLSTKSAWNEFYAMKGWGYWQDQLITTHPIETEVKDVQTAKGNFDGITYAKGAATLKQLHFFVGEDAFRNGLRNYFKKYEFKNTTREDFVREIAKAGKTDLRPWTKAWLQTAGPNRVQAKWSCRDGKIEKMIIHQSPSTSQALSPHRTRVGLFKAVPAAPWELFRTVDVAYSGSETPVKELKGEVCPDFVYPNVEDKDYALFALDPQSLKMAKSALTGGLRDSLQRQMVWGTLAQMVRDTKLPVTEYFELAMAGLEREKDDALLGILLQGQIHGYYMSYLTKEQRYALAPRFEGLIGKRLEAEPKGSNAQMLFADFFINLAHTPESLQNLKGWLNDQGVPPGLKIDQDRRWKIIETLAARGFEGASEMIAAEEKRDTTTSGQRYAFASRVALPRAEAKQKFWAELQKPDQIPYSTLRAASGSFNSWNHIELSEPFVKPLFEAMEKIDFRANDQLVEVYFERLFPTNMCSPELLQISRAELRKNRKLIPLAKRAWLEANDELSRCISVRKVSTRNTKAI